MRVVSFELVDMRHRGELMTGAIRGAQIGGRTVDPTDSGVLNVNAAMSFITAHPADVYLMSCEHGAWESMTVQPMSCPLSRVLRLRTDYAAWLAEINDAQDKPVGAYNAYRPQWYASLRRDEWLQTLGVAGGAFTCPGLYLHDDVQDVRSFAESCVLVGRMLGGAPVWPSISPHYDGVVGSGLVPIERWGQLIDTLSRIGVPRIIWWAQTSDTGTYPAHEAVVQQYRVAA